MLLKIILYFKFQILHFNLNSLFLILLLLFNQYFHSVMVIFSFKGVLFIFSRFLSNLCPVFCNLSSFSSKGLIYNQLLKQKLMWMDLKEWLLNHFMSALMFSFTKEQNLQKLFSMLFYPTLLFLELYNCSWESLPLFLIFYILHFLSNFN